MGSRKQICTVSLFALLPFLLYVRSNQIEVKASNGYPVHNIDTGLDYATIQGAINALETKNGHTIRVDEGTYHEHVSISKSIKLVGESRNTTIIDGTGTGPVVTLSADNASFANFMIRNGGHSWSPWDTCIWGHSLSNILIENNTVMDVSNGIIFISLHNSSMSHNFAEGCGVMGLHFDGDSDNCKMVNNTVINSFQGIVVEKSAGNFIQGNNLINNNVGVNFYASAGNLVEENNFMNNSVGIILDACNGLNNFRNNNMTSDGYNLIIWGSSLKAFIQSIDTSNIVDNRAVYYITDSHNLTLNPINCPNIGYLALVNCTEVTVEDIDLSDDKDGMLMAQSTNCSLINITLANARTNITLSGFSSQPLIHGGLDFFKSDNNLMTNSRITNNSVGVCLYQSSGNLFYHNSFVEIDKPVISNFQSPGLPPSDSCSTNKWDKDFEGNYWSNYRERYPNATEIDDSGIWNTPYVIDTNNTDNYPLMGIFSDFNATSEFHAQTISNSTISNFQFNGTAISFNVTGEDGTSGFCRICIPRALMNGTYRVFINGPEVQCTLLQCSNSTHSYLYFTYEHSTKEVVIVSEFPSFLILPLFMIIPILAAIVYKRKYSRR
jgi:parallel beta-helix repeat protein